MTVFLAFFCCELQLRFKSKSTYFYFMLWFAFSFLSVSSENFSTVGSSNARIALNGPFANSSTDFAACLFGVIIIAAIFGTSILRDFQRNTYQLLYTKPISKMSFLGGRWGGSFVTTVFCFSGIMLGTFCATLAPWTNHDRIGPNQLSFYLHPFFTIIVVEIFFVGSVCFAVAALTRKLFVVYLQGVALFMAYLIGLTMFLNTKSLEHFWSGLLDPVGVILLQDITKYWMVAEKNSLLLPLDLSGDSPGLFLYSRLLLLAIGLASLLAVYCLFPVSVEALVGRKPGRRLNLREQSPMIREPRRLIGTRLASVHQAFGLRTSVTQYLSLTVLRTRILLRAVSFWAILGILIVFLVSNGHSAGHVEDQNVWPVTYLMLQAVEGSATFFFYIVAALYSAELVWRERDNHFDGIHDALPVSEGVDWLSKVTVIAVLELTLLTVTLLVGTALQTVAGYYHYELLHYAKELYILSFARIMGFTLLALFIQTVVSNKFIGHAVVIGIFALPSYLSASGLENTLFLPGSIPTYTYSDMNGYGHFLPALFWSETYWLSIFGLFGLASIAYARRGAAASLRHRTRGAFQLGLGQLPVATLLTLTAIGSGGWFYFNTRILNEDLTAKDYRDIQAGYERLFKKYELLPQPKIIAVDTTIDIYPERRSFDGTGRFTLQNKTTQAVSEIYLTDEQQAISNVSFDRPFHLVSRAGRDLYSVYALERPLMPGDIISLTFSVGHLSRGFRDGNELPEFAKNGTFFDTRFFPTIGYNERIEIDDPRRRREEHLDPLKDMPPRGDAVSSRINLLTPDADWISYHAIVSTSEGQTALAPGYLTRTWRQNGRDFYEYTTGAVPTLDTFAYLSGRYQTHREVYKGLNGPVSIEVYYDGSHAYNIDEMVAGTRAGLDYCQSRYGPYQFTQFRIVEFPRYRTFAQSFPNTVPFSEGLGFIGRTAGEDDINMSYFVTAHELAHQWWGHQLVGGRVEGSNMLSETLAQYSAYMVVQRRYGKNYMHRVLAHALDQYLQGRVGEVRRERPLALVQREPYVWYDKGGLVMYTLADYIGEDRIDRALRQFLTQYRYANLRSSIGGTDKLHLAQDVYPDSRMLVDAIRAETPQELQYLIDDGFNRIVLYDNKAVSATSQKLPDGKYKVTLDVQARKTSSDDNGVESPMRLADYVDIGVFAGDRRNEKPVYMQRQKLSQERQTFTIVVDQKPSRAGIDPYNKLIDRISDDNVIDVIEQ